MWAETGCPMWTGWAVVWEVVGGGVVEDGGEDECPCEGCDVAVCALSSEAIWCWGEIRVYCEGKTPGYNWPR